MALAGSDAEDGVKTVSRFDEPVGLEGERQEDARQVGVFPAVDYLAACGRGRGGNLFPGGLLMRGEPDLATPL